MGNEEMLKGMKDLFANPLFQQNFHEFFLAAQREGLAAAQRLWNLTGEKNRLSNNVPEIYEKLLDFYLTLGFVPQHKYDQVLRENEELRQENKFLKDAIGELQLNIFKEGGQKLQETWREITDRQLAMHREIGKDFLELFGQWREADDRKA